MTLFARIFYDFLSVVNTNLNKGDEFTSIRCDGEEKRTVKKLNTESRIANIHTVKKLRNESSVSQLNVLCNTSWEYRYQQSLKNSREIF